LTKERSKCLALTAAEVAELEREAAVFERWYDELQRSFRLHTDPDPTRTAMVTAQGNEDLGVHRWYNLKEAYSACLPLWMVDWMRSHYDHSPRLLLDPFIGGGTTGVTLAGQGIRVVGVERNPFIEFVARAKALAPIMDPQCLESAINHLRPNLGNRTYYRFPKLTTFHNRRYFRRVDVQTLLAATRAIRAEVGCDAARNLLLLGVAAAITDVANLYKDGRALRYEVKGNRPTASEAIANRWERILTDLRLMPSVIDAVLEPSFDIYGGTATNLRLLVSADGSPRAIADATYDTILYSPPYLNNFDYSEVYKLELWLMGYITDNEEWRALRKSTIRSHPSVSTPPTSYMQDDSRLKDVSEHLEGMANSRCLAKETASSRRRMILGYFDDMYLAFTEQWRVLRPGGVLAYVVANSRHHYLPIATDVILGEMARSLGFEPLDLVVLSKRNGRTRQKSFLRESAVFLRKPIV
jgi:DNA modification methylase